MSINLVDPNKTGIAPQYTWRGVEDLGLVPHKQFIRVCKRHRMPLAVRKWELFCPHGRGHIVLSTLVDARKEYHEEEGWEIVEVTK